MILVFCGRTDPEGVRPPERQPTPWIYGIKAIAIEVNGEPYPVLREPEENCVDIKNLLVCADPDGKGIYTSVSNQTDDEIAIIWPDSVWVDEDGVAHPMSTEVDGRAPVQILVPNSERGVVAMAREKVYLVDERPHAYYYKENMIPWDQRSGDPDEARMRLVQDDRSFFYKLVLRKADENIEVQFEFKLVSERGGNA